MADLTVNTLRGLRGDWTRVRVLRTLGNQPRNANQLSEELDLAYTTVQHHLDVLLDEELIREEGDGYGTVYLPTEYVCHQWDKIETLTEQIRDDCAG